MGITFFDILKPADAYQDGWNDCAKEARAALADERRRHREAVAKMREQKRRRDIRRQSRGESAVDDRLHYRSCLAPMRYGAADGSPLRPWMSKRWASKMFRHHSDLCDVHGPKGKLP